MENGYSLFDTAVGRCGVAWSAAGLVCVQLPEASEQRTVARLREQAGALDEATPPRWVADATRSIRRHLEGRAENLAAIQLDFTRVPAFHRRVYEAARRIPSGSTMTYGEVASAVGSPRAFRAVGRAFATNPFSIVVPCHRILAANGKPGGFSAAGGLTTKAKLLGLEGCSLAR